MRTSSKVGFRSFVEQRLNVSDAVWHLEFDSELLFISDAGNTEASNEISDFVRTAPAHAGRRRPPLLRHRSSEE
jgi:hypothetical protein